MFRRRFRHDTVPQIENQGPPSQGFEDTPDFAPHRLAADRKQDRIEIALERYMRLELCGGPGERQIVIQAESGDPRDAREFCVKRARRAKQITGTSGCLALSRARSLRESPTTSAEARLGQIARPTVEYLQRLERLIDLGQRYPPWFPPTRR